MCEFSQFVFSFAFCCFARYSLSRPFVDARLRAIGDVESYRVLTSNNSIVGQILSHIDRKKQSEKKKLKLQNKMLDSSSILDLNRTHNRISQFRRKKKTIEIDSAGSSTCSALWRKTVRRQSFDRSKSVRARENTKSKKQTTKRSNDER